MSSVLLGLVAALSWGVNDFLARSPSPQGARPSLQWLAVAGVLTGVVLVSRSGETYEQSGYIPPGKLKTIVALALCASLGSAKRRPVGRPRP